MHLSIYLSTLPHLVLIASAIRHPSAQLKDLLAFPKYQVEWLNDLPLAETDAARCKRLGIQHENEFLDPQLFRSSPELLGQISEPNRIELIPLNYIHPETNSFHSYLCALPSSNTTSSQTELSRTEEHEEPDPVLSWKALSHLEGKCLYSTQGWFTYSYCHNSHVRQFRQARHSHPHPPGGYTPQEDPSYDAYTLGKAHSSRRVAGSKLLPPTHQHQHRHSRDSPSSHHEPSDHPVTFGLGPASRYLVQRWSDGTRCDKTGRPREIEVQVHCSMTTTDVIYMVKEVAICQYVIVIHSPHLCSLPGFKAERTEVEPAPVRCREVVTDEEFERWERGEWAKELGSPPPTMPKVEGRVDPDVGTAAVIGGQTVSGSMPKTKVTEVVIGGVDDAELKSLLFQSLQTMLDRSFGGNAGETESEDQVGAGRDDENLFILSLDEAEQMNAIVFDAEQLLGKDLLDESKTRLLERITEMLNGLNGDEGEEEEVKEAVKEKKGDRNEEVGQVDDENKNKNRRLLEKKKDEL